MNFISYICIYKCICTLQFKSWGLGSMRKVPKNNLVEKNYNIYTLFTIAFDQFNVSLLKIIIIAKTFLLYEMNKGLWWTCNPSRMFPIIPRCCSRNPLKHFREWMDGYTLPGRGVYMTSVTHPFWIYKPMSLGEGLSPLFTVKQQYVSLLCACSSYLTGSQNTKSIKNTINSSLYSSLYPSTLQNKLCLYYGWNYYFSSSSNVCLHICMCIF